MLFLQPLVAHANLRVVATIKPVHSLVAAVTDGVFEPHLLLDGIVSPHQATLKPSGVRALNNADLVFRVGSGLEGFLDNTLRKLEPTANVIELVESVDQPLLELRTGDSAEDDHSHSHSHEHGSTFDVHIWTDPVMAAAIVSLVEKELSRMDPANAERYAANARIYSLKLDSLNKEVSASLKHVNDVPFMVYHDSFQYFEQRYQLNGRGVVALQPEVQPGASGVKGVLNFIDTDNVHCLFSESQFPSRIVTMIVGESGVGHQTLDPLGNQFPPGPDMYIDWMRETARQIGECLKS
ncbi:hypothetical protein AB833_12430 [Chromatiales bacterium (ex Bugula neritina AB1)]|nr:hypothetical protein AB833_12430 [Chromatiales bacterium (ex Bugula neritina AB1)]